MYEKPEYLTPDGYKRSPKNPLGSGEDLGTDIRKTIQEYRALQKKKQLLSTMTSPNQPLLPSGTSPQLPRKARKGMSEKTARLIAMVLKDLLKS